MTLPFRVAGLGSYVPPRVVKNSELEKMLGLADAVDSGALKPGMTVAIAAFGAGFTWVTALVEW